MKRMIHPHLRAKYPNRHLGHDSKEIEVEVEVKGVDEQKRASNGQFGSEGSRKDRIKSAKAAAAQKMNEKGFGGKSESEGPSRKERVKGAKETAGSAMRAAGVKPKTKA